MKDPLQAVLQPGTLKTTAFPTTSRYHGIETTTRGTTEGKTVAYLRRRFVPRSERFSTLQEHTIAQAERLDNIASKYLGDPEQFWRLCDANDAMRPDELTQTIGRRIRITLPEGVPGAPNA
jgi:hypothetical protein